MTGRVFPAGTGGNPLSPTLGTTSDLAGTAKPSIRQTPDVVPKTVIPFTDSGVNGFVDGAGNRIWYPDTSATAVAITFVSAAESVDYSYVVKWTNGANPLTVLAASGKVGGTTTFAGAAVGDAYEFRSDGIDYQLVSRVGDFAVSGGPAAFSNLTIGGSATFSGTVAFLTAANISGSLSVGTLVVSGSTSLSTLTVAGTTSFSGTVVMNSLTVLGSLTCSGDAYFRGSLNVSATASVGALTIAGAPFSADVAKLGSATISNVTSVDISGTWTSYSSLVFQGFFKSTAGIQAGCYISTDNGTTRHLVNPQAGSVSLLAGTTLYAFRIRMDGQGNIGPGLKVLSFEQMVAHDPNMTGSGALAATATANTGNVNQFGLWVERGASTKTISSGMLLVYGYK